MQKPYFDTVSEMIAYIAKRLNSGTQTGFIAVHKQVGCPIRFNERMKDCMTKWALYGKVRISFQTCTEDIIRKFHLEQSEINEHSLLLEVTLQ